MNQSHSKGLECSVGPLEQNEFIIQDVASWVLRAGVIVSVLIMVLGLALSWAHGMPSVAAMKQMAFQDRFHTLLTGLLHWDGKSLVDAGIFLLVLTPIIRVAVSIFLFIIVDHDWFYALVTFVVLTLTLTSLLLLRHV